MIFQKKSLRIGVPLDPAEGALYTELVCNDDNNDQLDYIYQIIAQDEDRVNLTVDGRISW